MVNKAIVKAAKAPWPDGQIYVTTSQLAKRYKVSAPTIKRWEDAKVIPRSLEEPQGPKRWRIADLIKFEEQYAIAHTLQTRAKQG